MRLEAANPRLFGLDAGRTFVAFRQGWEGALRWPVFAWLSPQQPVGVTWPDGSRRICRGTSFDTLNPGVRARFDALVLPPEIVLTDFMTLPHLLESDLEQALRLHLQSLSPFPTDQIVWGWRVCAATESGLDVAVAFALRTHVRAHVERQAGVLSSSTPEVWADANGMAVVLEGFGEAARSRKLRVDRTKILVLLGLAILSVAVFAVSPLWQLRARVADAQDQLAVLQRQAEPYVDARTALVQANEKAATINAFLSEQVDAPQLLESLTALLPDSAWLSRLDVDGRRVRLTGQAADAAGLMESLRARPEFAELRALSPIMRGRDGQDSFNLEFVVMIPREHR